MSSVKQFIERWQTRGCEKGDTQSFWLSLLRDVLQVNEPEIYIKFEVPVKLKHTNFIDALLPDAKVIIEQKSVGKDLTESAEQSDGDILTPYEQAQRYGNGLPYSMRPRWIVTCNFSKFLIYDMETLAKPEVILLKDLEREHYRLRFLVDNNDRNIQREEEISLKVGEIVANLYDVLKKQYHNSDSNESLNNLNKLCVRLVFCMYSESTGIFGKHKIFRDYLNKESNTRVALIRLFKVLNTPLNLRDPYLEKPLSDFPYVNGNLFDDDNSVIPIITDEIKNLIVINAGRIDWSDISPTIFGAIFESTLNPITRRGGGMHYTSIANIHKVIDPLFMDDLHEEFAGCDTEDKLRAFQDKLASLKFLDPACGSGNFLTETYLSLRRLENDVLRKLQQLEGTLFEAPVKVSIAQFYGIEINDFAVSVAQVALWIAESQMIAETSKIIHRNLNFLPLKSYANIYEDNALRADWNALAPAVDYIMGNPPFVGTKYQNAQQKSDLLAVCRNLKPLDYVTGWFYKAAQYTKNTRTRVAFVATNSITQGEQVAPLWKNLTAHIDFAYKSFLWDSESNLKAHVHVVIIGLSNAPNSKPKIIIDGDKNILAQNINGYLLDAPDVHIEKLKTPLCDVPKMNKGSIIVDDGNLIIDADEFDDFTKREPAAQKFIRRYVGSADFINNKVRYCLWLVDCPPNELRKMPLVMKRVEAVREFRLTSKRAGTLKGADKPSLFLEIRQPHKEYIAIPVTSSERRRYVPMGFMNAEFIANADLLTIPDAMLYHFGVLTSSVHMAWMRAVCGRLEVSYRYSASIVYNNFVWCNPTEKQRTKIESTAQLILDTRAKYPDATLADLYDERTMPLDLRKAHEANDRAVMNAYGLNINMSEAEIVAELMNMYHTLTKQCDTRD